MLQGDRGKLYSLKSVYWIACMRAEVDSVFGMRDVDMFLRDAEESVKCVMHWAVEGCSCRMLVVISC